MTNNKEIITERLKDIFSDEKLINKISSIIRNGNEAVIRGRTHKGDAYIEIAEQEFSLVEKYN